MDSYQIQLGETVLKVPWWLPDALLIWLAMIGLVLLLFGRRLVRPALATLGMLGGMAFMLLTSTTLIAGQWPGTSPTPFIIIGGLVGALTAFFLWRIGVGVGFAVVVAIVGPLVYLILAGLPTPPIGQPIHDASEQMQLALQSVRSSDGSPGDAGVILEPFDTAGPAVRESIDLWWTELSNNQKWLLGLISIGGGVLAMLVGFALPIMSAAIVTSLFGAVFVYAWVFRLMGLLGESVSNARPTSAKGLLITIAAIAAAGLFLQITILRPRPKKEAEG